MHPLTFQKSSFYFIRFRAVACFSWPQKQRKCLHGNGSFIESSGAENFERSNITVIPYRKFLANPVYGPTASTTAGATASTTAAAAVNYYYCSIQWTAASCLPVVFQAFLVGDEDGSAEHEGVRKCPRFLTKFPPCSAFTS